MNTKMNRKVFDLFKAALLAVFCLALTIAVTLFCVKPIDAQAEAYNGYYYSQLDTQMSRGFYKAIKKLHEDGSLQSGTAEYDLVANNVVAQSDLQNASQDSEFMQAFGAARDAYMMDHPELFYIDASYLSINIGMKADQSYTATLGSGRMANYYIEGGFTSNTQVATAISAFDKKVAEIVAKANEKATDADKVAYVNQWLVDNVKYSYTPAGENEQAMIHTAYGAIVNGAGVCEGYSKAFKVVMDKLDIPCVLVAGNARVDDEKDLWQAHEWNYVQLDNKWYGIDTTWNCTTTENVTGEKTYDYYLLGNFDFGETHEADGVLSGAEFEFKYPALDPYNYGESTGGFAYDITQGKDANGATNNGVDITVSYNGKSATALEEDGLYLCYFMKTTVNPEGFWVYIKDYAVEDASKTESKLPSFSTNFTSIAFGVLNIAPNDPTMSDYGYYDASLLTDANIVAQTRDIENGYFGSYNPPPYAMSMTPSNSSNLNPEEEIDVTIGYDEKLVLAEGYTASTINVVIKNGSDAVIKNAIVSNIKWDENDPTKISFHLVPSKQYGDTDYYITLEGLIGESSKLAPNAARYRFWRKSVVCSKVFNDGRLWMNVYGNPTPLADEDLSIDGWTNENLEKLSNNQRSQLVLVASKPDDTTSSQMENMASSELGTTPMKSSTYDIDLLLCGCVQKVPEGSYMQVAFGFPDGYGPEDAGVTFKVYHYKKDADGNITGIEEVSAVVTEYGIIATVPSFSPFAIVAVDSSKVTTTSKGIYTRTVGYGGSTSGVITGSGTLNGGIATLKEGDSVTYTFTPDNGYQVDRVLLNGEVQTLTNGKLTVAYSALSDNNTIEAYYIAQTVASSMQKNGITAVYPSVAVTKKTTTATAGSGTFDEASDGNTGSVDQTPTTPGKDTDEGWKVAVVVIALLLGLAAIIIAVLVVISYHKLLKNRKGRK